MSATEAMIILGISILTTVMVVALVTAARRGV